MPEQAATPWLDLYWLPLGAGGYCVRWNGRIYDRLIALRDRRAPQDLYHLALELHGRTTYAIEIGPGMERRRDERRRYLSRSRRRSVAGPFRAFKYEGPRWPDGSIPDLAEAVDAPRARQHRPRSVLGCPVGPS